MVESSPNRGGPSRSSGEPKPLASFGFVDPKIGSNVLPSMKAPVSGRLKSPSLDLKGKAREQDTVSELLWCDSFAPVQKVRAKLVCADHFSNLTSPLSLYSWQADLAIHKKKVEQVEGWLSDALDGSAVVKKYRVSISIGQCQ